MFFGFLFFLVSSGITVPAHAEPMTFIQVDLRKDQIGVLFEIAAQAKGLGLSEMKVVEHQPWFTAAVPFQKATVVIDKLRLIGGVTQVRILSQPQFLLTYPDCHEVMNPS